MYLKYFLTDIKTNYKEHYIKYSALKLCKKVFIYSNFIKFYEIRKNSHGYKANN